MDQETKRLDLTTRNGWEISVVQISQLEWQVVFLERTIPLPIAWGLYWFKVNSFPFEQTYSTAEEAISFTEEWLDAHSEWAREERKLQRRAFELASLY